MEVIDAGDVPLERVVAQLFSETGLRKLVGHHGVACFVLARAGLVPQFYEDLINNIDTIDATTRHHIAFIVFHGNKSSLVRRGDSANYRHHVAGLSISDRQERSLYLEDGSGNLEEAKFDHDLMQKIRSSPRAAPWDSLSRATDLAATMLMDQFGIQESALPCLLFVDALRVSEPQVVRLSPEAPMKSLYSDVLAPLSDEFRRLHAYWTQREKIESHKRNLSLAERTLREFPRQFVELRDALVPIKIEIAAAEKKFAAQIQGLTLERGNLVALCDQYKKSDLNKRLALLNPRASQYPRAHEINRNLLELAAEKRKLYFEAQTKEEQSRLREVSNSMNNLRKKLGTLVSLPYAEARERLLRVERKLRALRTPIERLQNEERIKVSELYWQENRRASAEVTVNQSAEFDLEVEQEKAKQGYAALCGRGYSDEFLNSDNPSAIDVVISLLRRDVIGFSDRARTYRERIGIEAGPKSNKSLLLFLHGLGGNAAATWGKFPAFLTADPAITEKFEIGFYSFPTSIFRLPFTGRAPKIQELAAGLRTQIEHEDFDRINLICHSLGGLIARRYLIEEVKAQRPLRVDRLALFAVPNNGAGLASVAQFVSWRQNQIAQLCRDADIIEMLNEDWFLFDIQNKVRTKFIVGSQDQIVDRFSVVSYWGNPDVETIVDRGHINIIKPERADDLAVKVIRRFLLT